MKLVVIFAALLVILLTACSPATPTIPTTPIPSPTPVSRIDSLPPDAVKRTPADDAWPPIAAEGWTQPVLLAGPINTAGGEDSPFLTYDGQAFYFFFTPDVRIPAEKQLTDGVTGIWVSQRSADGWLEPHWVVTASSNELHLDGCPFAQEDRLLFCTVRESTQGQIVWFSAILSSGGWSKAEPWEADFTHIYQVGELHISADGRWLVFGSQRPGGLGGYDLWLSEWMENNWGEPMNLGAPVNTSGDENRPYLSPDGNVLWFDSASRKGMPGPAIFRSLRQADGSWSDPEEIVSQFAGEPNLGADGKTLYFVHHYFSADLNQMLEADIYVTEFKSP